MEGTREGIELCSIAVTWDRLTRAGSSGDGSSGDSILSFQSLIWCSQNQALTQLCCL